MDKGGPPSIYFILVGYPPNGCWISTIFVFLPILASSAFQNVPYSYFIIFMHLKSSLHKHSPSGPGMLMAWS